MSVCKKCRKKVILRKNLIEFKRGDLGKFIVETLDIKNENHKAAGYKLKND